MQQRGEVSFTIQVSIAGHNKNSTDIQPSGSTNWGYLDDCDPRSKVYIETFLPRLQ